MKQVATDLLAEVLRGRAAIADVLSLLRLAGYNDRLRILSVMLSCDHVSRGKQRGHTTDIFAAAAARTIEADGVEEHSPGNLPG